MQFCVCLSRIKWWGYVCLLQLCDHFQLEFFFPTVLSSARKKLIKVGVFCIHMETVTKHWYVIMQHTVYLEWIFKTKHLASIFVYCGKKMVYTCLRSATILPSLFVYLSEDHQVQITGLPGLFRNPLLERSVYRALQLDLLVCNLLLASTP